MNTTTTTVSKVEAWATWEGAERNAARLAGCIVNQARAVGDARANYMRAEYAADEFARFIATTPFDLGSRVDALRAERDARSTEWADADDALAKLRRDFDDAVRLVARARELAVNYDNTAL